MTINSRGINIVKEFESLELKPYLCPVGIPTIGYGSTFYEDGTKVTLKDKAITKDRAEVLLNKTLNKFEKLVDSIVGVDLNENQFSALVSFVFNIGEGNFRSSTMLKKLNASDFASAAKEFKRWNKGTIKGKRVVLAGLTRRRTAEETLFVS